MYDKDKWREYAWARKDRLINSGLCIVCGKNPSVDGIQSCQTCRDRRNAKENAISKYRRDNGLCYSCGKNKCESGTYCNVCKPHVRKLARESQSRLKSRRVSAGMCANCMSPTDDFSGSGFCLRCHCYAATKTTSHRGACLATVDELIGLWSGRCALTGIKIGLRDAELDHIIPVDRGGTSTADNLRWVYKPANRMKGKLTDDELIDLCKLIVAHKETHG